MSPERRERLRTFKHASTLAMFKHSTGTPKKPEREKTHQDTEKLTDWWRVASFIWDLLETVPDTERESCASIQPF